MGTPAFDAIVALTAAATKLPMERRRAVFAKLALTPEQKRDVLCEFMWRTFTQTKNDEPTDDLAWSFAAAAIGSREGSPAARAVVVTKPSRKSSRSSTR